MIDFTHSGSAGQDGSREKPYSGGIIFSVKLSGVEYTKCDEKAKWLKVNPCPDFGYRIDWVSREGLNAVCTPAPTHSFSDDPGLLELGIDVHLKDGTVEKRRKKVYVYTKRCPYHPELGPEPGPEPEPEPTPTGHPIICSDGKVYATTHELTWLLSKGRVGNAGGKTYFNGDKATLEAIIKVIPPKPQPEPTPDPEPEEPMEYRYFLPLRVVDDIDTGVFLSATQKAEVKLSLFKQRVPSSDEGELQEVKTLTLGAYNAITKMVKGNWHVEADLALIVSDVPIACCAVWVTKDDNVQYTGFPGIEA
jgi:hypothetical protein